MTTRQFVTHFVVSAGLAIVLGCSSGTENTRTGDLDDDANSFRFGFSLPPAINASDISFTLKHMAALNASYVTLEEDWSVRETSEGVFNWSVLTARLQPFADAGKSILLRIPAYGPSWRCDPDRTAPAEYEQKSCVFNDNEELADYVTQLMTQAGRLIDKIQFGNEVFSEGNYVGQSEDFVAASNRFYQAVKAVDPQMPVVLGSTSIGQIRWITACLFQRSFMFTNPNTGELFTPEEITTECTRPYVQPTLRRAQHIFAYANFDIVDIHLYDDPENWHEFVDVVNIYAAGRPVIVTEWGGPNQFFEPADDENYQAERIQLYMDTLRTSGVAEAYHFKLVEYPPGSTKPHRYTGLIRSSDMQPKPNYEVFRLANGGSS